MRKGSSILLIVVMAIGLTGCGAITNDFASTNTAIAQANADRYTAYTSAMVACGENAACQVGVSMALATGAGEQKFIQPERTAEVLAAFVPLASLGLQAWDVFYGGHTGNGNSQGYVITGDNNTLMGIGNDISANDNSSVSSPFSSSNSFSWPITTGNRTYTLGTETTGGTVTDGGVVDGTTTTTTTPTL